MVTLLDHGANRQSLMRALTLLSYASVSRVLGARTLMGASLTGAGARGVPPPRWARGWALPTLRRPRRARTGVLAADLSDEWNAFARNASRQLPDLATNIAFAHISESELDPKRKALWEQLRRAAEVDAVKAARATLKGEAGAAAVANGEAAGAAAMSDGETAGAAALADGEASDQAPVAGWRQQSRALGELQYWLITTGNADAEAAMIDVIQRTHGSERWLAIEADCMLRKGWSVHRNTPTNLQMEAARALLRAGKAKEAARAFAAIAEECKPPWAEALKWQGKVLNLALGDSAAAIQAYEQALVCSPRNYALLFELGALLIKDAAVEAQLGGPRSAGSAERAQRGAELLGRATELNPLLAPKVALIIGEEE